MARKYQSAVQNPWYGLGQGISQGIGYGIEQTMLKKQKKEDFERTLSQSGFKKKDSTAKYSPYATEIQIPNGDTYVKDLSPGELELKGYETAEAKKKSKPVRYMVYKPGTAELTELKLPKGVDFSNISVLGKPTLPKTAPVNKPLQTAIAKTQATLAEANSFVKNEIPNLERVKELNKDSYGGVLGGAKFKAESMLNMGQNDPKFMNTATVVNNMQSMVAKILKSTFGGQLSEGEREYLNNVMGALPKMSQAERSIAIDGVIRTLKDNATKAQLKYEELTGFNDGIPTEDTGEEITEDDIQETMRLHPEYSREQILQMIGGGQ